MKRKMQRFVTVSTAAALSLAMAVPGSAAYQPEQKFQDVSRSASYYEDVMDANYYGLMAGVSGKTFDTE
ncbi:S-layer homology domain-containing protein, partial [Lawsonibacter asaccharolyticus]